MSYRTITAMKYCVFITVLLFSGCCGCGSRDRYCLNLGNLQLSVYDNRDSIPRLADTQVLTSAFYLELVLNKEQKICFIRNNAILANNVYATSCEYEKYSQLDTITEITLVCDRDYSPGYPAGTPLNILFSMPSLEELNEAEPNETFRLYPKQAPTDTGSYMFSVNILADNSLLQAIASPVNIIQ